MADLQDFNVLWNYVESLLDANDILVVQRREWENYEAYAQHKKSAIGFGYGTTKHSALFNLAHIIVQKREENA